MESLTYIILALIALGFLIFIHELGHYFVARREGMRVEAFAIGFGPAIASWTRDGVEWKICLLPFGGYVKIAGMYEDDSVDIREVKDGYFSASPWSRIKVAAAGPIVNILFAIFLFTLIWGMGGREKNFSEYTRRVGWVDPSSELFQQGLRPGDLITAYDNREVNSFRDHLTAPLLNGEKLTVIGEMGERSQKPFRLEVKPYPHPDALEKGITTVGVMSPASYIIYDKLPGGRENPLHAEAPISKSGLQYGDRIFWVDGVTIYSAEQLSRVLNDERALITVQRNGRTEQLRVPRLPLVEYRLDGALRDEITDWQFEAQLRDQPFDTLYFIPYNLTPDGRVEEELAFVDKDDLNKFFPENPTYRSEMGLRPGDRILAVDGEPVSSGHEILNRLQSRQVNVIVQRAQQVKRLDSEAADARFNQTIDWQKLNALTAQVGLAGSGRSSGEFYRLKPFQTIGQLDYFMLQPEGRLLEKQIEEKRKQLAKIEDITERKRLLKELDQGLNKQLLGLNIQDLTVIYNPNPIAAFTELLTETLDTLGALVTGRLSPKFLAGPVGIVHAIQRQWTMGIVDVLFLLAFISQQLGLLNLLPIPVLDGGHIVFSTWEWITGKAIPQKTIEWLTIPFYFLLIGLAISLTYNDIARIIRGIFG